MNENVDLRASTETPLPSSHGEGSGRILLTAPRGYCVGMDRAVDVVEKAPELYGAPIYMRKEIVHNKFIVESLTKRGAISVQETDEVPEGACVVFSAHGVSPAVHETAATRHLATTDTTRPLVIKMRRGAVRFAKEDYDIILVGYQGHEEVEGTFDEAPDHIQVIGTPDEVDNAVVRDLSRVVWIFQTTLPVDETREIVNRLCQRFSQLIDPPPDNICYATQNRQGAVKHIVPQADVMVVVGSVNSSNFMRLAGAALKAGVGAAHRVDKVDELEESWFEGARTVGLTSDVSVPEIPVREVIEWLQERGFPAVEMACTEAESAIFALPRDPRADLKKAGMAPVCPHAPRVAGLNRTK